MKKMLFVFNAHAGKGQIRFHLLQILNIFTIGGYDVTVHPTQSKLDAVNVITEQGKEYDVIVVSGGDGTMNEAIKGIMNTGVKIPLGYIPAGTMNDFASSLGIPHNMTTAAEKIVMGETAEVDIGTFNDEYFTYVAGFGAFTDVSYGTSQQMKNVFGSLAYIAEGLRIKRLNSMKPYRVKIEYDGNVIEDDFIYGMICNSMSVGGFKGLGGKDVLMNDGVMEGLFIKNPKNLIELQQIINALLARNLESEYFYYFKTGKAVVSAEEEIPWTLDGEFGGNVTRAEISAKNKAICLFTSPALKILGGTADVIPEAYVDELDPSYYYAEENDSPTE
ncbi:MAG: diacylglycerol/lipid kinase family protein [Oscillospiraceae bacterium]